MVETPLSVFSDASSSLSTLQWHFPRLFSFSHSKAISSPGNERTNGVYFPNSFASSSLYTRTVVAQAHKIMGFLQTWRSSDVYSWCFLRLHHVFMGWSWNSYICGPLLKCHLGLHQISGPAGPPVPHSSFPSGLFVTFSPSTHHWGYTCCRISLHSTNYVFRALETITKHYFKKEIQVALVIGDNIMCYFF